MFGSLKLLPPWVAPVAALGLTVGGYVWGRHDGRQLERSAALSETVKAQQEAVDRARQQLDTDRAIAIGHAESVARLTDAVSGLLARPPPVVTNYKEVRTHGAATVSCPAGVSAEFVRDWNAAQDIADPSS